MTSAKIRLYAIAENCVHNCENHSLLEGRLHDRAKMARIRQKLERFQQFLQRNSEVLSVPCRVHRRLWTRCGTDKTSLFLCKNFWNRSSFCRIRAIFSLSCKRPFGLILVGCQNSLKVVFVTFSFHVHLLWTWHYQRMIFWKISWTAILRPV